MIINYLNTNYLMKYFMSFQKKKALPLTESFSLTPNHELAIQLSEELLPYGYVLSADALKAAAMHSVAEIDAIYHDLLEGIKAVVPGGGYKHIYEGFPNISLDLGHPTNSFVYLTKYYKEGTWSNEALEYLELTDTPSEIGTLTEAEFSGIFTDILYSVNSMSAFDKGIVEWFIHNGYPVDYRKISFNETKAYVGQKLVNSDLDKLPFSDATTLLRVWAAFSDGDEGLKVNTKFKNPTNKQSKMLLNTLDGCYNLEEAFKGKREMWLRMLFYLHPATAKNTAKYPNVAKYAALLRNAPKELETFDAKIERHIRTKDEGIFDLLKKRMGVFSRRLAHLMVVFGTTTMDKWLAMSPNTKQLVDIYNFLLNKDQVASRSAVLAGQGSSQVVTYKAGKLIDTAVLTKARADIKIMLESKLGTKYDKVFVDPLLYHRPLSSNNRASSMSLVDTAIGTLEQLPTSSKLVRMYCMWEGNRDIDLSAVLLINDGTHLKIGWNGSKNTHGITYSGDNTGDFNKNAEYLDIDIQAAMAASVEWIVLDAHVYSRCKFNDFTKPVYAGWEYVAKRSTDSRWVPKNTQSSLVIATDSRDAYLCALHLPTNTMVHLDISKGNSTGVSNTEDAASLTVYLEKLLGNGLSADISWDTIKQGHLLNLLGTEIVDDPKDADKAFLENTTAEEVMNYLI